MVLQLALAFLLVTTEQEVPVRVALSPLAPPHRLSQVNVCELQTLSTLKVQLAPTAHLSQYAFQLQLQ
jgi:hypothetical protein